MSNDVCTEVQYCQAHECMLVDEILRGFGGMVLISLYDQITLCVGGVGLIANAILVHQRLAGEVLQTLMVC